MAKPKKKLTAAEKRRKAELREKYMWIFIRGKQVRVERPRLIDGMLEDEWIEQNADDYTLHQLGLWEVIHARQLEAEALELQERMETLERDQSAAKPALNRTESKK